MFRWDGVRRLESVQASDDKAVLRIIAGVAKDKYEVAACRSRLPQSLSYESSPNSSALVSRVNRQRGQDCCEGSCARAFDFCLGEENVTNDKSVGFGHQENHRPRSRIRQQCGNQFVDFTTLGSAECGKNDLRNRCFV